MKKIIILLITMITLTACSTGITDKKYRLTSEEIAMKQIAEKELEVKVKDIVKETLNALSDEKNKSVKTLEQEEKIYEMYGSGLGSSVAVLEETETVYDFENSDKLNLKINAKSTDLNTQKEISKETYLYYNEDGAKEYSYDLQNDLWVKQTSDKEGAIIPISHLELLGFLFTEFSNLFIIDNAIHEINGKDNYMLMINAREDVAMFLIEAFDIPEDVFITHAVNYGRMVQEYILPLNIFIDVETYLPSKLEYDTTSIIETIRDHIIMSEVDKKKGETSFEIEKFVNVINFLEYNNRIEFELPKDAKEKSITYEEYFEESLKDIDFDNINLEDFGLTEEQIKEIENLSEDELEEFIKGLGD